MSENERWQVDQAEFQGFVKAKLEENSSAHKLLFEKLDSQEKRLRNSEQAISVLKVKSGLIGGIAAASLIVGRWLWTTMKS